MMRRTLFNVLIVFAVTNVIGIIIFYGWILSHQVQRRQYSADSGIIINGGSGISIRGEPLQEVRQINHILLSGHTLKPLKKPESFEGSDSIPPVPEHSESDDMKPISETVLKKYQSYPAEEAYHTVLILTPIHNVAGKLAVFLRLLQSLTYPHKLISVAFGEDSSNDNTLHIADSIAVELRKSFVRVDVFHFNLTGQVNGSWGTIHNKVNQFRRRKHLAQARNALLRSSLKHQDWVLWIDSDISYLPPDIIQQLLSAKKNIVVPLCVYMAGKRKHVFDKNTWRETKASMKRQQNLSSDTLIVEGYDRTQRLWLSDLRAEGRVVPIDGVGGCTLLVQSECHKNGLIFPEELFEHHLETEGLAKMAKRMGYGVYGMPFVEVFH